MFSSWQKIPLSKLEEQLTYQVYKANVHPNILHTNYIYIYTHNSDFEWDMNLSSMRNKIVGKIIELAGFSSHLWVTPNGSRSILSFQLFWWLHQCWIIWIPIYPLVNIQKAVENGHRNSGFSHEKWWFPNIFHSYGTIYQRSMGPILDGIFGASKAQELDLGLAGRLTEESGPFLGQHELGV